MADADSNPAATKADAPPSGPSTTGASASPATPASAAAPAAQLERGTYEIIRNRLSTHAAELRSRLDQLNSARREVFGAIETRLLATERVTTANNCVPRDMIAVGDRFIFGYNVHIGLKSETQLADVFGVWKFSGGAFHEQSLELISDPRFENDFKLLYKYYKATTFAKFMAIGPHVFMVFQVGKSPTDVKTFKWLRQGDALQYLDNRSDHEAKYPPQHEFEWTRTHRDLHRGGIHPHISIDDRLFVETVGGDLTIKVEDNTDSGEGIYSEPVENKDQVLDDAEIFYAVVGNVILLKIRPYQEKSYRYIVYSEKTQKAIRLDAIEHSCVLLPEGHGLIFANGYVLQSGEHKTFDSQITDLSFARRIAASNGEDYLYAFYNRATGVHVLLSYNMIEQRVDTPIVCHGYSLFDNGHLVFFKSQDEPQRHHPLQIWQTPYLAPNFVTAEAGGKQSESYLYKIGNRDIVRGMAECHEVLNLIGKDDTYANLYVDLVKQTGDLLDSYFWLANDETYQLAEVLGEIRSAAAAAVDEFEKVVRVRRNTQQTFARVAGEANKLVQAVQSQRFEQIGDFVAALGNLRRSRGNVIGLGDLKYIDRPAVESLEQQIEGQSTKVAARCVEFLLREDSLAPYDRRVEEQRGRIDSLTKVADARKLDEELVAGAGELEMLIDVVSNLKIDDATQRTRIIDNISTIYSRLNQARAALRKRNQELFSVEGAAEFAAQMKLVGQAVVNYLDVCDAPRKCDEYLTKMLVQIEELEGRFAQFDEFVVQLAEKREEVYAAFDSRKLALVEARNKRAAALLGAAERILKGIATRVASFKSINDIHGYFAADLMIDKIRDICRQLGELDDSVKIDDVQSRLKTIREDAVRQLKDRQELFVEGENIIRLGKHLFSVNVQALDLTTVVKNGEMCYHLTGTNFIEPIVDEALLATRDVWTQEVVSENRDVYRAEYLAYKLLSASRDTLGKTPAELAALGADQMLAAVQQFTAVRYAEGYVKGVHDHDAALVVRALAEMASSIGLLQYHSRARALASVFWSLLSDQKQKDVLRAKLKGAGVIAQVFPNSNERAHYVRELSALAADFARRTGLFSESLASQAGEYLFEELARGSAHGERFAVSHVAAGMIREFHAELARGRFLDRFTESVEELDGQPDSTFVLLRNWVTAFAAQRNRPDESECVDEAAAVLLDRSVDHCRILEGSATRELAGLVGSHSVVENGKYRLHYTDFMLKLGRYEREVVPRFESYQSLKKQLVDRKRKSLRLDEFRPRVLTSFVRNRLIDQVYLPMIGDNLAKQIGVVGEKKRTDLMGLLLLISPPGYGKTTLMEYVANRLGITFMKINGPAIGHQVTSLDPVEAPNASAREEVERLNLALEMGDNVMLYLDDIQHCNPELLQKFISLCDAQRKIEGVYQGRTRTYDLRGRKVAVVMAGNPYTESGEKFKIPDMLANRADTYNLGDVIGDNAESFHTSYLENALTSNPALSVLASRSQNEVYGVIKIAQTGSPEGVALEGNYSAEELNELVSVMRKLMRVRDVLLAVNEQYILSAAQSDDYRTEPPFKLQGSYRDMNKLAEKVVSIMNDRELESLIWSHYENQAQTLTTGAEANLLKLRELLGKLDESQSRRWNDIKRTFQRNTLLRGVGSDDKTGQVIAQLSTVSEGLAGIREALGQAVVQQREAAAAHREQPLPAAATSAVTAATEQALDQLRALNENLAAIQTALAGGAEHLAALSAPSSTATSTADASSTQSRAVSASDSRASDATDSAHRTLHIVNKVPRAFLDVIQTQFQLMQAWMQSILESTHAGAPSGGDLKRAVDETLLRYQALIRKMEEGAESSQSIE